MNSRQKQRTDLGGGTGVGSSFSNSPNKLGIAGGKSQLKGSNNNLKTITSQKEPTDTIRNNKSTR